MTSASSSASWWSPGRGGISVSVRVTPGARRTEVAGSSGGAVRLRVAAPAREGKANAELQRFLARRFGVRRSAVSLLTGERSREKTVWIAGVAEPPPDFAGVD